MKYKANYPLQPLMVVLLGVLVNMDRGFSLQGKKISLLMRTVDVRFVTLLLFVHF
jgi:hypothetical protein